MANLTIPEAIAENQKLSAAAKLVFADLFTRVRKGERAETGMRDIGLAIALGGDDLVDALRNLAAAGYARIDEEKGRLEDVIPQQKVRLTPLVLVEVMPILPDDRESVYRRRYEDPDGRFTDQVQVGRTVYGAHVSQFMGSFMLTVNASDDEGTREVVKQQPHHSLASAWEEFDGLVWHWRNAYEYWSPRVEERHPTFTETARLMRDLVDASVTPEVEEEDAKPSVLDWVRSLPGEGDIALDPDTFALFVEVCYAGIEDGSADAALEAGSETDGCDAQRRYVRDETGARWPGFGTEPAMVDAEPARGTRVLSIAIEIPEGEEDPEGDDTSALLLLVRNHPANAEGEVELAPNTFQRFVVAIREANRGDVSTTIECNSGLAKGALMIGDRKYVRRDGGYDFGGEA